MSLIDILVGFADRWITCALARRPHDYADNDDQQDWFPESAVPPIQPSPQMPPLFVMLPLCADDTPLASMNSAPTAIAVKDFMELPCET